MATAAIQPKLSTAERERVYRRNFRIFLADFVLFTIGFNILGPTTVIPDFVRRLTDIEVLIGLSSQLFEIGWLLPQLFIARQLVRVQNKKWWFVGPNIPVRTLVLILAGMVALLGPDRPGAILGVFFLMYALAGIGDGLVGVPWLDLTATSLDNPRRARMFGLGTALVGVAMLGIAPLVRLILGLDNLDFPVNYALVFALAGSLFFITVPINLTIRELPSGGQVQETIPAMREYLPQLWRVLREDAPFRAMIIVRVLVTFFAMASPFYIGFATDTVGMSNDVAVGNLLLMQTLGSVAGALLFSWLGDQRTVQFIRMALVFGAAQPVLALLAGEVGPASLYVAFLAAGVIQGSLFIGFLNWVVLYAAPDQRPIYTGLFNSVSAVALLLTPLVGGTIVQLWGYEEVFITALALVLAALFVAVRYVQPVHPTLEPVPAPTTD
ncbi:MAG: MFS transporter [Chloroflexi bacterium]|nr:MFS transporter [Chloroflexota bacterium]